jgi:hypothetical protein
MTDVPFPMLTTPGQQPQVSGGRLLNCYPEPNASTAGKPNSYWRVPGLNVWGTAPSGTYRGGILVNNVFYAVFGTTVYTWASTGGAGTALTGSVPGTGWVWWAANQNGDIALVSSGNAFIISSGTVANYPLGSGGASIGSPNGLVFHQSFFIFTYGSGKVQASDPNSTNINSLNNASAESKPDALYRPMPLGNGQLLLVGASTIEVWGGENDTGFPFSYVSTIYRGVPGPRAIAGNEDGWGKGIFFVGDDNKVSTLSGYTPTPISVPDLDQLIEAEPDKTKISVGVYVARGHGFVVVQGVNWCWEYDTTLQSWHERRSYLQNYWRGYQPICLNFGSNPIWLCGDTLGPNLLQISGTVRSEVGNPLRMRIETGPMGAFPQKLRINTIELYLTKGVSNALGHDPDETNATVEIAISRDGGTTWTQYRQVAIGRQAVADGRVCASKWGQADIQGVRWRFQESAGLNFAFMGADMISETLR